MAMRTVAGRNACCANAVAKNQGMLETALARAAAIGQAGSRVKVTYTQLQPQHARRTFRVPTARVRQRLQT